MAHIVDHVRLLGCTCDPPEIYSTGPPRYGEISHVRIEHDQDCPLVTDGGLKTAMIIEPEEGT